MLMSHIVFASVDLHWQQGEGDPRAEHLPGPDGGALPPDQPPLLVRRGQHLHEGRDPGLSHAR